MTLYGGIVVVYLAAAIIAETGRKAIGVSVFSFGPWYGWETDDKGPFLKVSPVSTDIVGMRTLKMNRTDCHRPSALIAADYTHCDAYFTWISFGTLDRQDQPEGESDMEVFNGIPEEQLFAGLPSGIMLKCDVCGSRHKFGSLFRHEPSGQYVKMGHDCARKYRLAFDLAAGRLREQATRDRRATYLLRLEKKSKLREFVTRMLTQGTPSFLSDLRTNHHIILDIRTRLIQWGSISDKQIALVEKIARQDRDKAALPPEKHVPVPDTDQRMLVVGTVVSVKMHDYGTSLKMTVKVETPDGTYLVWGTLPTSLEAWKGRKVSFMAKVQRSDRDEHFGFFKRPTQARVV